MIIENNLKRRRKWTMLNTKEFKKRIKNAIKILKPITDEATKGLRICRGRENKSCLKPNEKLKLILIHQLFSKSNRMMSNALLLFLLMNGCDVSYKTIERLYSDVDLFLHVRHGLKSFKTAKIWFRAFELWYNWLKPRDDEAKEWKRQPVTVAKSGVSVRNSFLIRICIII